MQHLFWRVKDHVSQMSAIARLKWPGLTSHICLCFLFTKTSDIIIISNTTHYFPCAKVSRNIITYPRPPNTRMKINFRPGVSKKGHFQHASAMAFWTSAHVTTFYNSMCQLDTWHFPTKFDALKIVRRKRLRFLQQALTEGCLVAIKDDRKGDDDLSLNVTILNLQFAKTN